MERLAYEYWIHEQGAVRQKPKAPALGRAVLKPLSGHPNLCCNLGASGRDLLRVARAALAADRLSPRRKRGKGIDQGLYWQRTLTLHISLENPNRWLAAHADVAEVLRFLTDDHWVFTFNELPPEPSQSLMAFDECDAAPEIALFSGGLDSALGFVLMNRERPLTAVSAVPNNVRAESLDRVLNVLGNFGVHANKARFRYGLESLHPVPEQQSSPPLELPQRSRGFMFLSLGAAVAHALGRPRLSIYESGVGAINMHVNEAQVGSQTTRAIHPGTLLRMERLLGKVLDLPVKLDLPFFLCTKGDLCEKALPMTNALSAIAISCDEGDRGKTNPAIHCGLCTSCLFRRAALFRALGTEDHTVYRNVPTRIHTGYELKAFHQHALKLQEASASYASLGALDPDISYAADYLVSRGKTQQAAEQELAKLYQRYACEVLAFYNTIRPTMQPAAPRGRKRQEPRRDLFASPR